MNQLFSQIPPELSKIAEKVFYNERLNLEEGLHLFASPHLPFIQALANHVAKKKGTFFPPKKILHLYPSNVCVLKCPLCRFYAKENGPSPKRRTVKDLVSKIQRYLSLGLEEVHIVSGLDPELPLSYYEDLLCSIQNMAPHIQIKALSAVEYDFLAKQSNLPVQTVLKNFQHWGLHAIPGGGAEIFDDAIRKIIAPKKIAQDRYLEIHKFAHVLGISSNCTMLYGHIEQPFHVLKHIDALRNLQDQTGGFCMFLPLKFRSENTPIEIRSSIVAERLYPIARLFFDNIPYVGALSLYETAKTADQLRLMGSNFSGNISYEEEVVSTKSRREGVLRCYE